MSRELVAGLSRGHGIHPYAKWRGAFWRLISLAELAVGPTHEGARAAAEETLSWLASPRRLNRIHERVIEGRTRRCASQDGRALWACRTIGIDDPRLNTLAESLVATQWPDGGWNCDVRPAVTHSSFHETWGPITGLAVYGAADAAERGADFLLRHRIAVGLADARASDALDLLESKRGPDGSWHCEGRWWKRPGSKGSGVEAVDWGDAADELLTERALGVLEASGRA